ncbi:MAG: hypothetical protein U0835_00955 [Isosphaeraceae bacterium]
MRSWIRWAAGAALALGLTAGRVDASDALLTMDRIDVDTDLGIKDAVVKTIFHSKLDENQYYYLPSTIRFATTDTDRPMFTLIKYNFVYDAKGQTVAADSPVISQNSDIYQGGVLKATFSFGLRKGELNTLNQTLKNYLAKSNDPKLKARSTKFRLARFPLDTAKFTLTVADPAKTDGGQILIGPFNAPITDDIVSVMVPLSKPATDVLFGYLANKDASGKVVPRAAVDIPIDVQLAMTYSGYDIPYQVKVTGTWDNVSKSIDTKASLKGNYWFVSAQADMQNQVSSMRKESNIQVEVLGNVDQTQQDAIKDKVMEEILKQAFDYSSIQPADGDKLKDTDGQAPQGTQGTLFGKPVGVSVGFSLKRVERKSTGSITFTRSGQSIITMADARFGKLELALKDAKDHLTEIKEGDWRLAKPTIELAPDVAPFFTSHTLSIAWPGPNGTDVLTWAAAKPGGLMRWDRNFGSKVTEDAVVPFTWQCTMAPVTALRDAGVTGIDSPTTQDTLTKAASVYGRIYGGALKVQGGNSYAKAPTALVTRAMIPIFPEPVTITFNVNGLGARPDLGYNEKGSRVYVSGVKVKQKLEVTIPIVTGTGAATKVVDTKKTAESEIALPTMQVAGEWFSYDTPVLYLFQGPGVKTTLDYKLTVVMAPKPLEKQFTNVPFNGDTILIDLAGTFPEIKRKEEAAAE